MLKRILINLLLTILISSAITSALLVITYYSSESFREDFTLADLLTIVGIGYGSLAVLSATSLLLAVPKIGGNPIVSPIVYFFGCAAFVISVLKDVHITSAAGMIAVWVPFIIFTVVHGFFFYLLITRQQPALRANKSAR